MINKINKYYGVKADLGSKGRKFGSRSGTAA